MADILCPNCKDLINEPEFMEMICADCHHKIKLCGHRRRLVSLPDNPDANPEIKKKLVD